MNGVVVVFIMMMNDDFYYDDADNDFAVGLYYDNCVFLITER